MAALIFKGREKEYKKEWRKDHWEEQAEYKKRWKLTHPGRANLLQRLRRRKRYKEDSVYREKCKAESNARYQKKSEPQKRERQADRRDVAVLKSLGAFSRKFVGFRGRSIV